MNTEHQPQQPPTRDPACCGTCAAIVSALTPEELVKAPGQGGDIFLKRGTPVEVERPEADELRELAWPRQPALHLPRPISRRSHAACAHGCTWRRRRE